MATSTFAGSFNITLGAAASIVSVTGIGFQPSAIIFWWNGRTASTDAVGRATHHRGYGIATSPTSRYAVGSNSQDATVTAEARCGCINNGCILETALGANAAAGIADFQSFDADGFTLVIDDQFVTNLRIHYWAIGGISVTDVFCGDFQPAGIAPTTQAVTGVGFEPDIVFFIASCQAANNWGDFLGDSSLTFGVMNGSTGEAVWAGGSNFGSNTMQTMAYCRQGECIARLNATVTGIQDRAEFSSFDADGFTVNWLERTAASQIAFLALKGVNSVIGNLLTQTDTVTAITQTGFGFQPTGALFVSSGRAEDTADTPTDNDRSSVGAASSISARQAAGVLDEDGIGTSEVTIGSEFDEVYINIDTASAAAGLMDIQSFDSDGFTCIMDDADSAQFFVWYVALGPAEAAGIPFFTSLGASWLRS